MIAKDLYIPKCRWMVHVFYRVTCYYTAEILSCLQRIECPYKELRQAYENMASCQLDTGLTYSNYDLHESVMVISKTSSYKEFTNSLFHETRHLTDHIAIACNMDMGGEDVAYLSGYIGGKLASDIQLFICDCECHQNDINNHIQKQQKLNRNGNKSRFKDRSCPACNRGNE